MSEISRSRDYQTFVETLKQRVRAAQVRAALSVNQELVLLYWRIGRDILARQEELGWGARVIEHLAQDLRHAFPEMKGFSARNLRFMRSLAEAYQDEEIVKRLVSQIPWGHNIRLMQKVKGEEERLWYLQKTIENAWSRDVLVVQIESDLFRRQGGAPTNFALTLPKPQSDLAQQVIKDPYNFDFLTLHEDARERELERGLVEHIRDFLLGRRSWWSHCPRSSKGVSRRWSSSRRSSAGSRRSDGRIPVMNNGPNASC